MPYYAFSLKLKNIETKGEISVGQVKLKWFDARISAEKTKLYILCRIFCWGEEDVIKTDN